MDVTPKPKSASSSHANAKMKKKKTSKGDLKVFLAFFFVAFFWFPIPNYFIPALFTISMLCWAPHNWSPVQPFGRGGLADAASVLGSGEAGAGIPGLGGLVFTYLCIPFFRKYMCSNGFACVMVCVH